MEANGIEAWIRDIPPITRTWVAASVAISLAVQCKLLTPLQLYYSWTAAFVNGQPYRALTTFLFFGPLSLDFVFHLFFFLRYSRSLETSSPAPSPRSSYLFLLLFLCLALLALNPLLNLYFLSSSLSAALVYLWARANPSTRIGLLVFVIRASYLPWALVALSWVVVGNWRAAVTELAGIAVGHVWWFGREWWRREMQSGGKSWLETPRFLVRLVDGPHVPPPAPAQRR